MTHEDKIIHSFRTDYKLGGCFAVGSKDSIYWEKWIKNTLTTYRAQVLEEKYKMLDGSTPDVVFINMVKGKQTHTEYLHPTN